MDRFGLIGFPISHSQSPSIFRQACGGKWEYDLIEEESFNAAWERFILGPYRAVNVTAPFKTEAARMADIRSAAVERTGAANILVKTAEGISAYNSDFLAVKTLLGDAASRFSGPCRAAVIGTGGAGRAAVAAADDLGMSVRSYRHGDISGGVSADIIIYTLPKAVDGTDRLDCRVLIEANYKDPCLTAHEGYIPGTEWLRLQASLGYSLMTGE